MGLVPEDSLGELQEDGGFIPVHGPALNLLEEGSEQQVRIQLAGADIDHLTGAIRRGGGGLDAEQVGVDLAQSRHGVQHRPIVKEVEEKVVLRGTEGALHQVREGSPETPQVVPGREGHGLRAGWPLFGKLHEGERLHMAGLGGAVLQETARIADMGMAGLLGAVEVTEGRIVAGLEQGRIDFARAPNGQGHL